MEAALIHGLPDDIALFCLARVPRKYHTLLKCVSKKWKELVCSEEWYACRRKQNWEETWIYALCRDKSDRISCYMLDPTPRNRSWNWKSIRDLPSECSKRKGMGFEVIGKRLYLLGGCGWVQDATDQVFSYDASINSWQKTAVMSTARCYFACEALNDKIYAIGGVGSNSSDPLSWDTYDPCTNTWIAYSDPNIVPDIEDSVVVDGKIYIRCGGSSTIPPHIYSVVYEPSNGTWQHADDDMVSGWHGPSVVIDGVLYVLDQTSGTRLMMWRKESREWVALGRLSSMLTQPPCRLVAVGSCIFIIGKGLSTVVYDLGKAGDVVGVMVSSSIPKLTSVDDVICCKTLSL